MASNSDKILEKLDRISEDITSIKISLAEQSKDIERNADDLQDHMRRTALLEESIAPLEKHVAAWAGIGKGIAIVGIIVTIGSGLIRIIGSKIYE